MNKPERRCYPVVAITGHRPGSLSTEQRQYMQEGLDFIASGLVGYYGAERFLTGLALGADMIWAELALKYGIEYDAYIPFEGQEDRWSQADQKRYKELRSSASSEKVFGQQFSNKLYHARNDTLIRDSDLLVAVWRPSVQKGGTFSTVQKSLKRNHPTLLLDMDEFEVKWLQR